MSRLDSAIRRLQAQRACLEAAACAVAARPGIVLELGLGNGRSFDHLRALMPHREIFAFDRTLRAHPDSMPDDTHLFLGEMEETLPAAARRLGPAAVLAHADIGNGIASDSRANAAALAPLIPPLMRTGGLVVADQPLPDPRLVAVAPPAGVPPGRYFLYRVTEAPR